MTRVPRFAVLRQADRWPAAQLAGLQADADGTLSLLSLPGTYPYDGPAGPVAPSGLAVDSSGYLYIADTEGNRLFRDDLTCGARIVTGEATAPAAPQVAEFHHPAGVCAGPCGWLFVADTGAGRIVVLTRPGLIRRAVWRNGLRTPVALAGDGDGLLVADPGRGQVLRLRATGELDDEVTARFAAAPGKAPRAVVAAADGLVYVADADLPGVGRFYRSGAAAGDPILPECRPAALAAAGRLLYVADDLTRRIFIVDLTEGAASAAAAVSGGESPGTGGGSRGFGVGALPVGRLLGVVGGFHGVVSALAALPDGRLWIKPGAGPEVLLAAPGRARAAVGTLVSGPHDAGEEATWFRVAADASVPDATTVTVETAFGAAAPGPWQAVPGLDALPEPTGRHLWLRVRLTRRDDAAETATPSLRQVTAVTTDRGLAGHLPEVYLLEGSPDLPRLVALAETVLAGLEDTAGDLHREADPATASRASLARLATWQQFDMPAWADTRDAMRRVLRRAPVLAERRGTCRGVADVVELHTGVRPHLYERFADRGVWSVGARSVLGIDTMLLARDAGGVLVGSGRLGESGPDDPANTGAELFAPWAHRVTVLVPYGPVAAAQRRLIRRLVEREKPAHVVCHVCFVEPELRVGVQARLGVDAVVARDDAGGVLGTARLDRDARAAGRSARPVIRLSKADDRFSGAGDRFSGAGDRLSGAGDLCSGTGDRTSAVAGESRLGIDARIG